MNTNHIKENITLSLELVPQTMWGKNVRAVVSADIWNTLRLIFGSTRKDSTKIELVIRSCPKLNEEYHRWYLYKKQKTLKCEICNAIEDELELHEQWQYDDKKLIQHLVGLISVCQNCHLTIHFGIANKLGLADKAKEHLALVNQWTKEQTDKHIHKAFEKWQCRSQNQYKLDLSWLTQWVPESRIHLEWLETPTKRQWSGHNRLDAIAYAKEFLLSNAVIIDTETTGLLDYENVEVIELAIINMQGEVIYNSRFRSRYTIPKRTTDIHGITDKDVADKPTFKDEYPKILEVMNSKIAIAYNAKFDEEVIKRTCKLYEIEPPECRWECAMRIYQLFLGAGKRSRLPNATHDALNDCKAVLDLLWDISNVFDSKKETIKTRTLKIQKPSEVINSYWLYANRKEGAYPKDSKNSGKWLIFVPLPIIKKLDGIWEKIKLATEQGLLGNCSKTATARQNPNAVNIKEKVICVYTYDWTDKADVKRIREKLRELGITHKIPYKSDQDTFLEPYSFLELYSLHEDKKISKYYE